MAVHAFNTFVRVWKEQVRKVLHSLSENYQIGLETGTLGYAAYSIHVYLYNSYFVGKQLVSLEPEMARYNHGVARLKQEAILSWNNLWWQVVLNLMGHSDNPCRLTGDVYDEKVQLERYQQMNDRLAIHILHLNKCILHYLFQEDAAAVKNAEIAEQHLDGVTGMLLVAIFPFYDSLARLALYPSLPKPEQKAVLTKVSGNQEKMQNWAFHAPMNFQHKYDLVEAEKARVLGQDLTAMDFYEKAIAGARENEYLQEEALAYELAAKFYLGRGMEKIAQTYLTEAHYRYQQWGALAKVRDLEARYPQFLSPKTASKMPTDATILGTRMVSTSTKIGSQWLDLNSIMKAAQTLSGEIVLSRLLEKMMHIVIENAGASIGFLLLPQQDNWFIEAQGQVDSHEIKVLQSLPIDNQPIGETIIHYVVRTKENLVLNNASVEGQFTRDAHIISQRPQSVLCAPLINQGQLSGLLYLENHLTTGAFTPERLEVLKVLSSQLAISIENALLYRTLEQKVEERTAQLARRTEQLSQANQEITALNEQLKEENLHMSAELDISRHLQQMLLPKDEELEAIDCLDIAGVMEPAEKVGGDYYDVLQHNGRILFAIGDVTGHGLESGALAIMVQSSIRTLLALNETDPVKWFSALNQMVFHNVQRMNVEKSLTLALIDYQKNQLYLSGQHEEMIVVRQGKLELIDTVDLGFPVGLDENLADFVNKITVPLNAGDVVVLYTDGITEAENIDKQMYGQKRLCEIIQQHWQQTAQEIREAVIDDVRQFIGEQKVFDDITLLVLKQQ
jgi:serine phosphatase RsbU (regulator of sigma subunit)